MTPLLAAVLLSLVSAGCYAAAAIVQERLAATTAPSHFGLLRSAPWWAAAALQGSGALLHVAALGLGPLTVVQPLGVLTLVLAAPMAALLVRRPVTGTGWRGVLLASAGLAGILLLTGSSAARPLDTTEQLLVGGPVLAALLALTVIATSAGRRVPLIRGVSLATAAGIAYGGASVFVKTVADSWDASSLLALLPALLLTGVLAASGLAASQASYRGSGLTVPLATATVVNPVVAAAVGILLLDEGFRFGVLGELLALTAAAVATWGLVLLASDSAARHERVSHASGDGTRDATGQVPEPVVIRAPAGTSRVLRGARGGGGSTRADAATVPPGPRRTVTGEEAAGPGRARAHGSRKVTWPGRGSGPVEEASPAPFAVPVPGTVPAPLPTASPDDPLDPTRPFQLH
ncbi:DMT family transporter [Streptomyces daliensis]|uniref:DMT family transporter n=1 Tax=Streptomyces daliensis TaxID=299421 RepID=A0A8T4IYH8_9ACTN|nr:DMT family transporter [Streptomyces daliensis]